MNLQPEIGFRDSDVDDTASPAARGRDNRLTRIIEHEDPLQRCVHAWQ